jgi:hypothetical protein
VTKAKSPPPRGPKIADGSIRVSKVAGREGGSFISPDIQRKKITAWAELRDVEVVRPPLGVPGDSSKRLPTTAQESDDLAAKFGRRSRLPALKSMLEPALALRSSGTAE